jgi:DNA-binding CsgD family transcriptional regulator
MFEDVRPLLSQDADDRLSVVCRTVFDAVLVLDEARRCTGINEQAVELLRAPADVVVGSRIEDFVPEELWPALDWFCDLLERDGQLSGTSEVLRGDGSRSPVEFRCVRDFDGPRRLLVVREILTAGSPAPPDDVPALSPREREVLQLASHGGSTREIAEELVLSPRTVKAHLENVYAKLGVGDRTAAVGEALRRGLIR